MQGYPSAFAFVCVPGCSPGYSKRSRYSIPARLRQNASTRPVPGCRPALSAYCSRHPQTSEMKTLLDHLLEVLRPKASALRVFATAR